jgi:hypothetical protein
MRPVHPRDLAQILGKDAKKRGRKPLGSQQGYGAMIVSAGKYVR